MKIIETLQKLINHQRSADDIGNVAEAEAFAAKIAELLFTHKLSMSEVEIAAEERDEPVSQESVDGFTAPWAGVLAMGVCSASFCKVIRSHNGYVFIGRPSDRQAAITMFRYLSVMGKSLCDAGVKAYKQTEEFTYASTWRPSVGIVRNWNVSFLRGYAQALYNRLKLERQALTTSAEAAGTSLMYIGKSEAAIAAYMAQQFPRLRTGRSSSSNVHSGAYGQGQAAGSRVSLKAQHALHA